jgi:hypothetical protein
VTAPAKSGAELVRELLGKGRSAQFVADATGWPLAHVQKVVAELRRQADTAVPAQEPPAEPPRADLGQLRQDAHDVVQPREEVTRRIASATELLVRAASIEDRRVRSTLGRARKAMTDLAAQVTRHEEQTSARARIAALEAELAAARAALRPRTAGRRRTTAANGQPPQPDSKAVRAWAAANGVTCPATGRPPRRVRDAYAKAQVTES